MFINCKKSYLSQSNPRKKEKYNFFTQIFNQDSFPDFAFMVILFGHMNKLNTKPIGKSTFAYEMYTVVKA